MSDLCLSMMKAWAEQGLIRTLDYQLAVFVGEQQPEQPALPFLAMLVSAELAAGNVCLPLDKLANPEQFWPEEIATEIKKTDWLQLRGEEGLLLVPATGSVSRSPRLMVLDYARVYLYRYWIYETAVAAQLRQRACSVKTDLFQLQQDLAKLFDQPMAEIDWQMIAAAVAVQKRFAVISGGPGTGKTTTVIKLLALYIEQKRAENRTVNIHLAAPTGKAAARLAESISSAKKKLKLSPELSELIPTEATTLHRLMGVIPNSNCFRHDAENPLHLDLLVLDEASMVDLPMMARLLDALPREARVILLGDRDQLASVEAGSVLGDICSWPGKLSYSPEQVEQLNGLCSLPEPLERDQLGGFADCLALLRKSYRFDDQSGIGFIAKAVNQGSAERVKQIIEQGYSDLKFHRLSKDHYEQVIAEVVGVYNGLSNTLVQTGDPGGALERLGHFQLLCALREGPYGVSGLNERVRLELKQRGVFQGDSLWYPGRPVIITRNDPGLSLYNGDVGLVAPDETGRLKVWFEQNGTLRAVLPSRLPEHDTAYAMTVHKSQGSEFNRVVLLLPPEESPLLSRELLYTGITRAKQSLLLCTTEKVLRAATQQKTERAGGLALRLWEAGR